MNLDSIRRVPLAHLPTLLEPTPRLGTWLGLPHLLVKRDDNTGLALGGNKARKLEYLLADAQDRDATVLITTGGVQSNHARMTAAAARKLGMRAILFLLGEPPREAQGNLLLDALFDADVRLVPYSTPYSEVDSQMVATAEELSARGDRPYIIPVGGSTPLGCLGYANAVGELAEQARAQSLQIDAMVVASGSTGTLAGMLLGAVLFMPETRVTGVSVALPKALGQQKAAQIANAAAEMLDVRWRIKPDAVEFYDDWLGPGYGVPTPEGNEAIGAAALHEGLVLDPVYTGKGLSGVRGLAQRGGLRPEETVVFWHTGGAPALFAFGHVAAHSG